MNRDQLISWFQKQAADKWNPWAVAGVGGLAGLGIGALAGGRRGAVAGGITGALLTAIANYFYGGDIQKMWEGILGYYKTKKESSETPKSSAGITTASDKTPESPDEASDDLVPTVNFKTNTIEYKPRHVLEQQKKTLEKLQKMQKSYNLGKDLGMAAEVGGGLIGAGLTGLGAVPGYLGGYGAAAVSGLSYGGANPDAVAISKYDTVDEQGNYIPPETWGDVLARVPIGLVQALPAIVGGHGGWGYGTSVGAAANMAGETARRTGRFLFSPKSDKPSIGSKELQKYIDRMDKEKRVLQLQRAKQ